MTISASACAKTILFGEHAVVYGEPAIAVPLLNTRTTAELLPNQGSFLVISKQTGLNSSYEELPQDGGIGVRELPETAANVKVLRVKTAL